MPNYDFRCASGHTFERIVPYGTLPPCVECGAPTEKVWAQMPNVIPDDVPGGFVIENIDRNPMTFYSKSEYRDALAARGMRIKEGHHVGNPAEGSDKGRWNRNPNTGRLERQTRECSICPQTLKNAEELIKRAHPLALDPSREDSAHVAE